METTNNAQCVAAFHRHPSSHSTDRFPQGKENRTFLPVPSVMATPPRKPTSGCPKTAPLPSTETTPDYATITGSRLLRQHWQQLQQSASKQQKQGKQTNPATAPQSTTRRRLLDTGAVRLDPATRGKAPPTKGRLSRIGIDGTQQTPSKELLRPTASSRHQQSARALKTNSSVGSQKPPASPQALFANTTYSSRFNQNHDDDSTQYSFMDDNSLEISFDSTLGSHTSSPSKLMGRSECNNPVAWTLLNHFNDEDSVVSLMGGTSPAPVRGQPPSDVARPQAHRPVATTTFNHQLVHTAALRY